MSWVTGRTIIVIQLVHTTRGGITAHCWMTRQPAREVFWRIVQQKKIEAPIAVVVEERCVRGKTRVSDSVFLGLFSERTIAIVDKEKVCSVLSLGVPRP